MNRARRTTLIVLSAVTTLTMVAVSVLTVMFLIERGNDEREACERRIEFQDAMRSMWVRTFDRVGASDTVDQLRLDLNELLPKLGGCPPLPLEEL